MRDGGQRTTVPEVTDALPTTVDQAAARLTAAPIPDSVLEVGRVLHAAGHQAVLVGGAVRDCLRGVPHADWDLATSATPQEVLGAFRRTIPTGIDHGTVTVLIGHGDERQTVEVTTFRGEGAYTDGRRPTSVAFLRSLDDDLARRDFTINAFAWDPFERLFVDRFGGLEDLRRGVVRAVGDPLARFREDGLRTMRAVRFCAVLGFCLDAATEAAIPGALDVFDKVSRERVRVELFKLLTAESARLGLEPMLRTGLWPRVLPPTSIAIASASIGAVADLAQDAGLRLARLLWPHRDDPATIGRVLDGLRLSRAERRRCDRLVRPESAALAEVDDPVEIRRIVARLGREHLDDVLALIDADAATRSRVRVACEHAVLDTRLLAISARDLMDDLRLQPGPIVGELLDHLLEFVITDPAHNTHEALRTEARRVHETLTGPV